MKKFYLSFIFFMAALSLLMASQSVPGSSYNAKLRWLDANAQNGGNYAIEFNTNQDIDPTLFSYKDRKNISITITGVGAKLVILSLNTDRKEDSMFAVGSGVTLILNDKLELRGRNNSTINSYSLITVDSGGSLIMNNGKITGHYHNFAGGGGGVYVAGSFTMNGGEISGNFCSPQSVEVVGGSGVFVAKGGILTMNGGKISDNYGTAGCCGLFVDVGGTLTMSGGEISNNAVGGVRVCGAFTMSGGEISNNKNGGVYVSGTFIMKGGKISAN